MDYKEAIKYHATSKDVARAVSELTEGSTLDDIISILLDNGNDILIGGEPIESVLDGETRDNKYREREYLKTGL